MNFLGSQHTARRNTVLLLVLFGMAVTAQVVALHLAAVALLRLTNVLPASASWWTQTVLLPVAGGTGMLLLAFILRARHALSERGGEAVALRLGGRRLHSLPRRPEEAGLLNVVEEMAIAAGLPVPWVYVFDGEPGINAMAAGFSADNAVIAVTEGALRTMPRDELQALVAHEFSHLVNGDVRFNTHLLGLLAGIHALARLGNGLLQLPVHLSGRENKEFGCSIVVSVMLLLVVLALFFYATGATTLALWSVSWVLPLLVGVVLVLAGGLGRLFSRLIQRAVARQREYLADAAAVQFTRHPAALDRAFRRLSQHPPGSYLLTPEAALTGHLFFASPTPSLAFSTLFDTHPALAVRRQRLATASSKEPLPPPTAYGGPNTGLRIAADGRDVLYGKALLDHLPRPLYEQVHVADGAQAVILALMLATDEARCRRQVKQLEKRATTTLLKRLVQVFPHVKELHPSAHLPLLALATPCLRTLPADRRQHFRAMCEDLTQADGDLSLLEAAAFALLDYWLRVPHGPSTQPLIRNIALVWSECGLLLSALAHAGADTQADARRAFDAARRHLPDGPAPLKLASRRRTQPQALLAPLRRLATLAPESRCRVLEASAQCVLADEQASIAEMELLRLVATLFNSPLPEHLHPRY